MSKSEAKKSSKARRWVRKWEEHIHCSVCGLSMEPSTTNEFCSAECEAKYTKWSKKRKKKDKVFTYIMIGSIVVIVIIVIANMSLGLF